MKRSPAVATRGMAPGALVPAIVMVMAIAMAMAMAMAMAACGGGRRGAKTSKASPVEPETIADHIVALLPPNAQIVVEIDLARLRANPVVGATITKALEAPRDMPKDLPTPPLATAEVVVFAAYGVGTSGAATIAVIASKQDIPDATRIPVRLPDKKEGSDPANSSEKKEGSDPAKNAGSDPSNQSGVIGEIGVWAMGPAEQIRELEARATLAIDKPIHAAEDFLRLRARSMPDAAPGASLRVTARLPFDARVALAKQSGLESAPAQLSIWADVVDDFAMIVDADSDDPGDNKQQKKATARLERLIRGALQSLSEERKLQALGLAPAITRAKLSAGGTWIRTIIVVGPALLKRVVERANTSLAEGGSS